MAGCRAFQTETCSNKAGASISNVCLKVKPSRYLNTGIVENNIWQNMIKVTGQVNADERKRIAGVEELLEEEDIKRKF